MYTHKVPRTWDINYIMAQPEIPTDRSYGFSGLGDDEYVFSYEGSQEEYEAVVAMLAAYPVNYANNQRPARWAAVKAERERREVLPAPTPSGPVDTDDRSKIKITGVAQAASLAIQKELVDSSMEERPFDPTKVTLTMRFTLADNTFVNLTAFEITTMALAVAKYINDVHEHARTLRELIDEAADITEMDAIDTVNGWPAFVVIPQAAPPPPPPAEA